MHFKEHALQKMQLEFYEDETRHYKCMIFMSCDMDMTPSHDAFNNTGLLNTWF